MNKKRRIDSYFVKKNTDNVETNPDKPKSFHPIEDNSNKLPRIEEIDTNLNDQDDGRNNVRLAQFQIADIERDPGKRRQICEYPINQQDEIRRAYIKLGPYQHKLSTYPNTGPQNRKFQSAWFVKFPSWLEYSPSKNAAFCLPCYVFYTPSNVRYGTNTFTTEGFNNWKKVNGKDCAFLTHVGKPHCSSHNIAVKDCNELMAQSGHIDKVFARQTTSQIADNRLRLVASLDSLRYCAFQAISFRGHNECETSLNRGNFIEFIKRIAEYNKKVCAVVLENAPGNAKYTSPMIQKELLSIFSKMVQKVIREEIGDYKYCIAVDESRDESKREQMAIVIRFVDKDGFVKERFLDLVHVKDTKSETLKNEISIVLARNNLSIQNMRGQGYDGASNMRGKWKGLQALFLSECPYAYYVHCFAHKLQLALVAASRQVKLVHNFFNELIYVVNVIGASSKRNDLLHDAQKVYLQHMIDLEEIETGTGANQIGTLQRPGDTRWSSHFSSVCSVIKMYHVTCSVLLDISDKSELQNDRGDGEAAFKMMRKFGFVFILHLMKEILGITDALCQCLQHKSQDILNAMNLVSSTLVILQNLRAIGWDKFIGDVIVFCEKNEVKIPDMNAPYNNRRFRASRIDVTNEHHYHFDIFNATIDAELEEISDRFNEESIELLRLSKALDPKNGYSSFNIDDLCNLATKFYPMDFTEHEIILLRYQLQHYEFDVINHESFQNMDRISDLCQGLIATNKAEIFYLIDRLMRLVLTLPVSTATTERSFSAMKLVKTRLRNKMEDEFLASCLILYIEKGIAQQIDNDSIVDEFYEVKNRRAQLK